MAAMPIYNKKTSKRLLLQNHSAELADILQETYKAHPYIKDLNSFGSDHKQTLNGWGKSGKNDENFGYMDPLSQKASFSKDYKSQCTDNIYEVFMNSTWQLWLPWQPFMKNFK